MNGTSVRNLHKLGPLLVSKRPGKVNLPLDSVDLSFFGLALSAVDRVNFRVIQGNDHGLERPASSAGVKRDRHRSAGAERSQKKVVGRWSGIGPTESDRFIAGKTVLANFNCLGKAGGISANDDVWRTVRSDFCHGGEQQ